MIKLKVKFLDVTIIANNNRIEFDWFHKATFSWRYLNYESRHPLSYKKKCYYWSCRSSVLSLTSEIPREESKECDSHFN